MQPPDAIKPPPAKPDAAVRRVAPAGDAREREAEPGKAPKPRKPVRRKRPGAGSDHHVDEYV